VEILKISPVPKQSEWIEVQIAIDGTPSVPFMEHASTRERFTTEESWISYLCRRASEMISIYGDSRHEIPNDPRFEREMVTV